MRKLIFLTLILLLESSYSLDIFDEIPDRNVSHCSRKLSVNSEVGCSSKYPSSSGIVLISENATHLTESLRKSSEPIIVVIPIKLFIKEDIASYLRQSKAVAGIFTFSPNFPTSADYDPPTFSENSACPNGNYTFLNDTRRQCDVSPKWNPPASEYGTMSWPFPVVYASANEIAIWEKITTCYNTYNREPIDDTRCYMEIRNFMSAVKSSQTCYYREVLLSYRLEQSVHFCSQLGGVNLMLRSNNLTAPSPTEKPNPTILVITRVDSLSMFDRKATSALGVLPSVSVLTSAIAHLMNQPAFKAGTLRKNILFAFLDNEALSFMGSQRFLFDLTRGRIAQASGVPFTGESIESVIELAGVGLPTSNASSKSVYYLLSDPKITQQTLATTQAIWKSLNDSAGTDIVFLNGSVPGPEPVLLPPSVSTQALLSHYNKIGVPLSHTVISDRPGKPPYADGWMDSFLDTRWPPNPEANAHLLQLANTLADALHREATEGAQPIPGPISGVKPAELMNCFIHDPGCDLLRMHLEPEVVNFLLSLGGPIPMQTYEPVDGHSWRVSHVVARLIMGLTGERLAECPPTSEYGAFTYMYGYYNGSSWCYRSLIETSTGFFFLEQGEVASPGWVRSFPFENKRFVRLYRSSSTSNDILALVLGILITSITCIIAFLVQWFSPQLFVKPYDSAPVESITPTGPL